MIKMGQQTLVKNLPQFLAPYARALRFVSGCPGPIVLRELAKPVRFTAPVLRATTSLVSAYPLLRFIGCANANTLVCASLLRSATARHFSATGKSGKSEENESVSGAELRTEKLTLYQPPKIKAELASEIDQVAWSYTLYRVANQYVLSVMCGTIAQYNLCIPLNAEEISMVFDGRAGREALAAKIRYSPDLYRDRRVEFS